MEISNVLGSDSVLYIVGPKLTPRDGVRAYLEYDVRMETLTGILSCRTPLESTTERCRSPLFTRCTSRLILRLPGTPSSTSIALLK